MKNRKLNGFTSYLNGEKIVILDIGARYGIHPRWSNIASSLSVYAFEPDTEECERINASSKSLPYHLECLPYALGDANLESVPLYVCRDPGSSSLYPPNMDFVRHFHFASNMEITHTLQVSTSRLNDICEQKNLRPDFIKIDTQGYELNILKGSGSALEQVKLVEVEVEFNEQYKQQPLFSDVDLYMRSRGFILLGLRRSFWRRKIEQECLKTPFGGQIMHGDAIYFNDKLLNAADGTLSITDLVKFCVLFSTYQQDDFVAHLLMQPHPAISKLPASERLSLAVALQNRPSDIVIFISGFLDFIRKRFWLPHTKLRKMVDILQSKYTKDWHDPDFY